MIEQTGCILTIDGIADSALHGLVRTGEEGGRVNPPPNGFYYKTYGGSSEDPRHWLIFTGQLSADHRIISGTCDGEYPDHSVEPMRPFFITCSFTLTRQ